MLYAKLVIKNKLGLHARAAVMLSQTAKQYNAKIEIIKDNQRIDAKSIIDLMILAASQGTSIIVETSGQDEKEALYAVVALIEDKFAEEE